MDKNYNLLTNCESTFPDWFINIANQLLNNTYLIINSKKNKIIEIEFYFNSKMHPDPFVHCHKLQKSNLMWYFHRSNNSLKGGSFKGLDITFGNDESYGGILIRSILTDDNIIINGPSLCVDYIIQKLSYPNLLQLDNKISTNQIIDTNSPMHLEYYRTNKKQVFSSPRVGLTLKRINEYEKMPEYIMKNYRFVTSPDLNKGKINTILSLYNSGYSIEDINKLTKSTLNSIKKHIKNYNSGSKVNNFQYFKDKQINAKNFSLLYGYSNIINNMK